jgi:hypothetical protein
MEEIYSSETSVDTQRTTRRYIPDNSTLLSRIPRVTRARNEMKYYILEQIHQILF